MRMGSLAGAGEMRGVSAAFIRVHWCWLPCAQIAGGLLMLCSTQCAQDHLSRPSQQCEVCPYCFSQLRCPPTSFLGGQIFFSLCLFLAFPSPQCPFGVCSFSKSFQWLSFWGGCTFTFLKWFCVGRCVDFVGEEGTLLVSGSRYISHNAHPYAKQTLPCIPMCMSLLSWFPFKNGVIIFIYTLLLLIERVLPWNFCPTISMTGCQHKMEKA